MKTLFSAMIIATSAFSASAATLSLPSSVWATSLNGEPVSPFASELPIGNGTQVVELRYSELLQLNPEDHEMVTSAPLYLSFNEDGSEQYQLLLPDLEDEQAVRQFAAKPRFTLRSEHGTLTSSQLGLSDMLVAFARMQAQHH
ncbi:hypothetical protein SAMN04488540_12055 [Ferrimonas sediminum]|uniref:DUF2057 domain-containing protein n=1 Tax=Ferrimonas sediminum TaxID=718193 RepID=A0A1G8ZPJ5_9GAMM|nr:DUF2057 family protein [Ferrimonas sediminum]SDK16285.1 hypothetical protein SAMN04488540_12055 [Ferrimonas sediminum]